MDDYEQIMDEAIAAARAGNGKATLLVAVAREVRLAATWLRKAELTRGTGRRESWRLTEEVQDELDR